MVGLVGVLLLGAGGLAAEPGVAAERAASGWLEVGSGSASAGGISGNATASEYATLALDAAGRPVVAWHDRGLRDVEVAGWNGTAWDRLGVGVTSPGGADEFLSCYPSLAALGGAPVLAWVQERSVLAFALYVRRWDGSAWVELGTGSATAGGVSQSTGWPLYPSLAATADGRLVLAWQDNSGADDEIRVRQWTGSTWDELGAGSGTGGGISHSLGRATRPAVAAGAVGRVAVAWIDDASGAREVYVRLWDGAAWIEAGAGSASGGGISASHGGIAGQEPPALAFSPAGHLLVAWTGATGGKAEIYVRRWDGSRWAEMGAGSAAAGGVSASPGPANRPTLALTAAGTPILAWQEQTGGLTQVLVKRWNGRAWVDAGAAARAAASARPLVRRRGRPPWSMRCRGKSSSPGTALSATPTRRSTCGNGPAAPRVSIRRWPA